MMKRGTMGPPKLFFQSTAQPLKRESSPPLTTFQKNLAHDEKHKFPCCVVVLQSFKRIREVGRAAFRTPPTTPPGRLLSPPCSQNNPHKVSKKLPKKRNVETIYIAVILSV